MRAHLPGPPPGLARLRGYERGWLRGDLLAGVTVAAYLVPQVMAYAEVAGLPPVTGLWAMLGAAAAYAFLGSSRQLSVGPESTTALMTAAAIGPLAAGQPSRYAVLAAALALLVGGICVLARLLRLGFVSDLLSRPVLVGYLAGVAVVMIVGQLGRITGLPAASGSVGEEAWSVLRQAAHVHLPTAALAAGVLALLFAGSRLFPRAPIPLAAMLLAAVAVAAAHLDRYGVAVLGSVPSGVPLPAVPFVGLDDLSALALPAVGVAVVGYTDNVLTARAFAGRSGDAVDANAELLSLGAANVASAAMHGFPVSSSGSRTAIADSLGARSQLHSLVSLVVVVLTLLVGQGVLAGFPKAALGALVVWAATRLVAVDEFRRLARFRTSELMLALGTTVAVLTFDILYGVLVAVVLSTIDLLRRVARPHDGILGYVPGLAGMHDIDDHPGSSQVPGLVVYRYDSPLFFANAEDFRRRALAAVDAADPPAQWLLLNVEANVQVDLTALDALDALRTDVRRRGVEFAVARLKTEVADDLRRAGLLDRIGADRIFATLPTAVAAFGAWQAERAAAPDGAQPVPLTPAPPPPPRAAG